MFVEQPLALSGSAKDLIEIFVWYKFHVDKTFLLLRNSCLKFVYYSTHTDQARPGHSKPEKYKLQTAISLKCVGVINRHFKNVKILLMYLLS